MRVVALILGFAASVVAKSNLGFLEKQPGPACANIECGALECPPTFQKVTEPGHCCPYCFNPDIKIEAKVTGATGSNGGKESTFCPKVFCFPLMCPDASKVTAATAANGKCCESCDM